MPRLVRCAVTAVAGLLALTVLAAAHDIPADVKVNVFVRPLGKHLELIVRVPLAAMVDIDFPMHGPGYLDLARAEEPLRNAAKLHLIDNLTLYENGPEVQA